MAEVGDGVGERGEGGQEREDLGGLVAGGAAGHCDEAGDGAQAAAELVPPRGAAVEVSGGVVVGVGGPGEGSAGAALDDAGGRCEHPAGGVGDVGRGGRVGDREPGDFPGCDVAQTGCFLPGQRPIGP